MLCREQIQTSRMLYQRLVSIAPTQTQCVGQQPGGYPGTSQIVQIVTFTMRSKEMAAGTQMLAGIQGRTGGLSEGVPSS